MKKKTKKWIPALGVLALLFVLYGIWRVRVPEIDAGEITAVSFAFNPVGVAAKERCVVSDRESVRRLCDHVDQMEANGFALNRLVKGGGWAGILLNFYKGDLIRWTVSISGGGVVEYQGGVFAKDLSTESGGGGEAAAVPDRTLGGWRRFLLTGTAPRSSEKQEEGTALLPCSPPGFTEI